MNPSSPDSPDRTRHLAAAIRSIVLHVEPGADCAPRLEVAAALARRLDATLIGVGAEMIPSLGVPDPLGMLEAQWLVEMRRQLRENLDAAKTAFTDRTAGLTSRWLGLEGLPIPTLARIARGADLIVAGGVPLGERDVYTSVDTAELVLLSGRPVLVAPPAAGPLRGDAVVVAWKDTREARRALADALPFLKAADAVVVLEVCERTADVTAAEARTFAVVEHLNRHGVEAMDRVTVAPPERVSAEINAAARQIGADLVVMGAYGHSRIGEWIFGGVTRDQLRKPEQFLLLSH
jgi:nucleotide-binding universal stress UspA family protein